MRKPNFGLIIAMVRRKLTSLPPVVRGNEAVVLFVLDGDPYMDWTSNTQCDTIIISEVNRQREVQINT